MKKPQNDMPEMSEFDEIGKLLFQQLAGFVEDRHAKPLKRLTDSLPDTETSIAVTAPVVAGALNGHSVKLKLIIDPCDESEDKDKLVLMLDRDSLSGVCGD